ncbi:hypothetical protein SAMN05216562_2506 [Microbulbifer marinus]|uniref:Uncharacterized protein n=1 Tax=Microbulbifer marinus TaxID=658218 RepID=A0A1H4A381_9GAMM|nr:hypothetical protein SAMN05216562_2506 [Microbulbifer marinus]
MLQHSDNAKGTVKSAQPEEFLLWSATDTKGVTLKGVMISTGVRE